MEIQARETKADRKDGKHYVTADNHIFVKHKDGPAGVIYLKCKLKDSDDCSARLHLRDGKFFFHYQHNHGDQLAEIRRIAFVNECVKRAAETLTPLKQLFDEVRLE